MNEAGAAESKAAEIGEVDIMRIMEMIPHRYPFLMIDRVTEMKLGKSAVGIKNVTINEPHFQGHFPRRPVMPGVLIIESMAQTSAVLVVRTLGEEAEGKLVYFMTIDECRFRKPVFPGDVLKVHVETLRSRRNVWKMRCEARVDGQVKAEAMISAMILDE
jgi:3-hydroxyacyl-[acyl-carrier-protein] dehydratase